MEQIKVYYNSACPVCKAGVADQQCRMDAQQIADVAWVDIHLNPELAKELGTDLESVREQLHVKNVDGSIRVGTDAFAVLFQKTHGQKWMGRLLGLPVLRQLSQIAYRIFARGLYCWNRFKKRW
jgi:predicted DCC family thiol-disulfide oxidoreductase YuxK